MKKWHDLNATRSEPFLNRLSRRCAWLIAAGLFAALIGSSMAASDVPFTENFDYPDGDLDGTNGWSATVGAGGAAIVTNGTAALRNASISNGFNEAGGVVTLDFELSPLFTENAPTVPADATFAFYVFTNGAVVAYSNDSAVTLANALLVEGATNNFQVEIDYTATNWSLTVDSTMIATNFGFYYTNTIADGFTELGFVEGTTNAFSYLDTIDIEAPWFTLPFTETFEDRSLGSLDGQLGWVVTDTIVTNAPAAYVNTDSQAGLIQGESGEMTHTFIGSHSNVWTDLYIQPFFGDDSVTAPSNSSFAFYVNTNGYVVAFTNGVTTQLVHAALTPETYTRFTVNSDYSGRTWDLYIGGTLIEADLPFSDSLAPTSYTMFGVEGALSTNVPVDDIGITLLNPLAVYPYAEFLPASGIGPESTLSVTGTVVLTKTYASTVTVDYALLDDASAVAGEDYTFSPGTLTFDPGQLTNSFTFAVINDTEVDGPDTLTFGLTAYSNALPGINTNFTYTIQADNEDVPPTISFVTNAWSADESVVNGTGTVHLSKTYSSTVTVDHVVIAAGSSATPGTDYTYTPGTLTFNPGDLTNSFTFTITNDVVEEPDETIKFGLSNLSAGSFGAYTNFTYTILEDTNDWYLLPFVETFEMRTLGALDGQIDWMATNTVVTNTFVKTGGQAGRLQGSDAEMLHDFSGTETNVWTDLWIQPVFSPVQPSPPTDSSFAFYVNTNGYVVVFTNGVTKQLSLQLTSNEWVRFTVNSDYDTRTWDLYVSENLIEEDLPFSHVAAPIAYTEFGVDGASSSEAPVDDIAITLTSPISPFPAASFDPASATGPESALTVTGTVVLAKAYTGTVSVDVELLEDNAAVPGQDYVFSTETLTFLTGERTNTFTFTVINDSANDGPDDLVFGLTNYSNAIPGLVTNFTYKIEWDVIDTYVLPFLEPFEERTIGNLQSQNGWTSTNTVVTNAPSADINRGAQAGRLTSTNGYAYHPFGGAYSNVWTDIMIKPAFGEAPTEPLAGKSFAFYCDADGYVVAYTNLVAIQLAHGPLTADTWVRFTVESDYATKTWDLYVDRTLVAPGLPFTDLGAAPASYTEFGVHYGGNDGVPLDDVNITLDQSPNWVYGTLFKFK